MAAVGRLRLNWGPDEASRIIATAGFTSFAMASLNTGWCTRFIAPDTRDVKSVNVNWATVATPGTVQVRIETIDATSGKPTGSLYDANAVLSFTPSAGWQTLTFASLPTTGLTAGTAYGVVLLTTVGGTTQTLRSHSPGAVCPTSVLTAADGTTRTNFADVSGQPILSLIMEDDVEESVACCPFAIQSHYKIFGTQAAGMKFVVPANLTISVDAVEIGAIDKVGTPAGDLRVRIFNSSDAAVAGTTVTIDKDYLGLLSLARRARIPLLTPVSLTGGTYRVVLDSASSANSSNCWQLEASTGRSAAMVPSGWIATSTADVTAGTITWTDTNTDLPSIVLRLDNIPDVSAGGGGAPIIGSPIVRGLARVA